MTDTSNSQGFETLGLSPLMLEAVDDLGYIEPTPVQAQAIPVVLSGRDLMAAAQTGTGKTAAFLLPAMDRLPHVQNHEGPHLLVITPTRELAQQIEHVAKIIGERTNHRCVTVVGGLSYRPQIKGLRNGCDVLVATPGRLQDLIDQKACNLSNVDTVVIDEADRLLDMGFLPEVRRIVSLTPQTRQTLLLSATLDDSVIAGITDIVHNPVRVEIAHKGTVAETVDQYLLPVGTEAKNGALVEFLTTAGFKRVIVFCRTKRRADTALKRLHRANITCAVIHGDRSQNQRQRALTQFRNGEIDVLVATDVLARGIDVSDVNYVLNFDVPEDPEDYIHRVGRTGRAGESGWAITFVTGQDLRLLRDIERLLGKAIPTYPEAVEFELGEDAPELDEDRQPGSPVKAARQQGGSSSRGKGASHKAGRGSQEGKAKETKQERKPRNKRENSGERDQVKQGARNAKQAGGRNAAQDASRGKGSSKKKNRSQGSSQDSFSKFHKGANSRKSRHEGEFIGESGSRRNGGKRSDSRAASSDSRYGNHKNHSKGAGKGVSEHNMKHHGFGKAGSGAKHGGGKRASGGRSRKGGKR